VIQRRAQVRGTALESLLKVLVLMAVFTYSAVTLHVRV